MFAPNLSRLSLRPCPTGVDPPSHSAARDDVMSEAALVATILASIRRAGTARACTIAVNWCRRVSQFNRGACEGNEQMWRMLAERVFPNWRQAVFPPMDQGTNAVDLALEERWLQNFRMIELPWSGHEDAMSWKDWFFALCRRYMQVLRMLRGDTALAKRDRKRDRERHRAAREAYEELEFLPDDTDDMTAEQLSEARDELFAKMQERHAHREESISALRHARKDVRRFVNRFGQTADSKRFVRDPDWTPDAPPEPTSSDDEDTEWELDYMTDTERWMDAEWQSDFDDSDNDEDDATFFDRIDRNPRGPSPPARWRRNMGYSSGEDDDTDDEDEGPNVFGGGRG